MDGLRINIESLVVEGETALDEDRVAAAIRAQAGATLDADVLSQLSRAIVQSVRNNATG